MSISSRRRATHGLPPGGKVSAETFDRVIAPRLGASRPEVLVGPHNGVDVSVVDLGGGQVMAVTADPFFVMPELGWRRAAWFAVHIVASDACTSGLRPAYFAVDLNLPPSMTEADLAELWEAVDAACTEIGVAVITGHTGRYEGCSYPMLGGATMISVGGNDRYITPRMARPGDALVITKGAAIETTGLFGALLPGRLCVALGRDVARAAEALFWQMSVVEDASIAVDVGIRDDGVTTMHDATERGIWGGLAEVAEASDVGMVVDQDAIILRPEVRGVCDLFGVDPYATSSEGTLLITCRPHRVAHLIDRLTDRGIAASRCGEIVPPGEGVQVVHAGRARPLETPEHDPFWPALSAAMRQPEEETA